MDAALPRINRLNTGSLPGLQRLFQLGGRGKRSGNRPETAGGTEVIPVESDGRAVRIFKALGRFKSHAEGIGAAIDDGVLDIGFKVLSFEVVFFDNMGNAVPIASDGSQFSTRQKDTFRKLTRNRRLYISHVVAVGPDGIQRTLKSSTEVIVK